VSITHSGISRTLSGLAIAAAATLLIPVAILAQAGPGPANFPGHWRGGGGFGHGHGGKVVTGEPYSATAVSTSQQTLSNGTTISHQATVSLARDNEGRTMRSETFTGGQSNATVVSIFDPVTNQRIEYNTGTKKARIFVLPASNAAASSNAATAPGPRGPGGHHSSQVTVASESLGTQTIAGVSAEGTKTTRTVAAGAFGNSQPLVSTEEKWYSADLQIVLQSTRTDPRSGQSTYTVSNLQRAEPAASLFQVPAGYESKTIDVPARPAAQ
jgi:hypothetical protein